MVTKSIVSFMLDPTGDIPWDEEPTAADVVHVSTVKVHLNDLHLVTHMTRRS